MADAGFKFDEPENLGVLICERVRDGHPILNVFHDVEGDWQFLCGGDHDDGGPDGALLVCLSHVVAGDPSLNQLATMCRMHHAVRRRVDAPWVIHDEMEDAVRDNISKYGWHAMKVSGDDENPEFTYTIGLYKTHKHPEIIWPSTTIRRLFFLEKATIYTPL